MKRRKRGFSVVDGEPLLSERDLLIELQALAGGSADHDLAEGAADAFERATDDELSDEPEDY